MKILITGANGYIGRRLIPILLEQRTCAACVREASRFDLAGGHDRIHTIEVDFLDDSTPQSLPRDLDVALYLIHSMGGAYGDFAEKEQRAARNFSQLIDATDCQQIIYLSGTVNETELSAHLSSRLAVEKHFAWMADSSDSPTRSGGKTAGDDCGLRTRCQPIAVRNVIQFLVAVMLRASAFNRDFDIGGPKVLTYRDMLAQFCTARGLKRLIITVPVRTPRLSSYWLYFINSTSFSLPVNLVDSMKLDVALVTVAYLASGHLAVQLRRQK